MSNLQPEIFREASLLRLAVSLDLYQLRRFRLRSVFVALAPLAAFIFEGVMSLRTDNMQGLARLLLTIGTSLAFAYSFRSFTTSETNFLLTKPFRPQSLPWYWLYQCLKPTVWLGTGLMVPLLAHYMDWKVLLGALTLVLVGVGLGLQLAITVRSLQLRRQGSVLLLAAYSVLVALLLFETPVSRECLGAVTGSWTALLHTGMLAGVILLLLPWVFTRALKGTPELIGPPGTTMRRATTQFRPPAKAGWNVFCRLEALRIRRFPWLVLAPTLSGLGALILVVFSVVNSANAKPTVALSVLVLSGSAFAFPEILTRHAGELRFFASFPGALNSLLKARFVITVLMIAPWAMVALALGGSRQWEPALISSTGLFLLVPTSAAIGSASALVIVTMATTQMGTLAARVASVYIWLIYVAAAFMGIGAVTQYGKWSGLPATVLLSVLFSMAAYGITDWAIKRKEWGR